MPFTLFGSLAGPVYGPSDAGLFGWAYDPSISAAASNSPAAGLVVATRIKISACTISNIWVGINSAGGTLTAGQNFAGLYNSSGATLLSATADQTTPWTSTSFAALSMPLLAPQAVSAGFVYVALFSNGTTIPKFQWANSANVVNANLTNPTARFAHGGTGATVAMPASLTLSTSGDSYWFAVN